jgi:hypothetical protein
VAARITGEFGAATGQLAVANETYRVCSYQLKRFSGGGTDDYKRLNIQMGAGVFAVAKKDFPVGFTAPGQKFHAELSPHDLPEDSGAIPIFVQVEAALPRLGKRVLLAAGIAGVAGAGAVYAVVRPTVQDEYTRQQTGLINRGGEELRETWQAFKKRHGVGDPNDPSSYGFDAPLPPALTEQFAQEVTRTLQARGSPSEPACVFLTLLEHQVDLSRRFGGGADPYPSVTDADADKRAIWTQQRQWLDRHPEQQAYPWAKRNYEQAIAAQSLSLKKHCLGVSLKPLAP